MQEALQLLQAMPGTAASQSDCLSFEEGDMLSFEEGKLLGFGLWADGVPIKFDRSESLEMLSLSIPGLDERSTIRLPITCINKKYFLRSGKTRDALFKVIAWSFQCMLQGRFPERFWDGSSLDKKRMRKANQSLLGHGILLEIRGDWACYKSSFRMPGWNSNRNCCFVCQATPATLREVGPGAAWRGKFWDHDALLTDMLETWGRYSPIFEAPFSSIKILCIDWLHTADLGVAQDFLGNCMFLICSRLDGPTHDARVQQLFADITEYYSASRVESRLNCLTSLMIRKAANKSPKLRSKAGEARDLIDWAAAAVDKFLQGYGSSSEEEACRLAAKQIQACYQCLSRENFDSSTLRHHAHQFLGLYTALESTVGQESGRWRFKPKFHLWLRVCEQSQSSPSLWWTYRDESFGGTIAQMSRSRGGAEGVRPMSLNVLTKFCAQHKVPEF